MIWHQICDLANLRSLLWQRNEHMIGNSGFQKHKEADYLGDWPEICHWVVRGNTTCMKQHQDCTVKQHFQFILGTLVVSQQSHFEAGYKDFSFGRLSLILSLTLWHILMRSRKRKRPFWDHLTVPLDLCGEKSCVNVGCSSDKVSMEFCPKNTMVLFDPDAQTEITLLTSSTCVSTSEVKGAKFGGSLAQLQNFSPHKPLCECVIVALSLLSIFHSINLLSGSMWSIWVQTYSSAHTAKEQQLPWYPVQESAAWGRRWSPRKETEEVWSEPLDTPRKLCLDLIHTDIIT